MKLIALTKLLHTTWCLARELRDAHRVVLATTMVSTNAVRTSRCFMRALCIFKQMKHVDLSCYTYPFNFTSYPMNHDQDNQRRAENQSKLIAAGKAAQAIVMNPGGMAQFAQAVVRSTMDLPLNLYTWLSSKSKAALESLEAYHGQELTLVGPHATLLTNQAGALSYAVAVVMATGYTALAKMMKSYQDSTHATVADVKERALNRPSDKEPGDGPGAPKG